MENGNTMKLQAPAPKNTNKLNPLFINKPAPPKQKTVFIATPMFGGNCNYMYMISLINLLTKLGQAGIPAMFEIAANESLITKARNILVEGFLKSQATHLLFIDADLGFQADDVVRMIQQDKDIIGGQYAKKKINWDVVKSVVANNPDIPGPLINAVVAESTFKPIGDQLTFNINEPVEVESIATGLMLIKREVFEEMAAKMPEIEVVSGGSETMDPKTMTRITDAHRKAHAFFDVSIDKETRAYTSEDFTFCKRWRGLGGKIFLAPWTKTVHVGTYEYVCDLAATATWAQKVTTAYANNVAPDAGAATVKPEGEGS
jgi:hypothetical protein